MRDARENCEKKLPRDSLPQDFTSCFIYRLARLSKRVDCKTVVFYCERERRTYSNERSGASVNGRDARFTLDDQAYGASRLPKRPKTTVLQSSKRETTRSLRTTQRPSNFAYHSQKCSYATVFREIRQHIRDELGSKCD